MIWVLAGLAFAQDAPIVEVTAAIFSADGLYVGVHLDGKMCKVQGAFSPLLLDDSFPKMSMPAGPGLAPRCEALQVDTYYRDETGGWGVTTTAIRIRRGPAFEGDVSILHERLFPYCDLSALTDEVVARMPREGKRAARALLAIQP